MLAASSATAVPFAFVSPAEGDLVAGRTEIRFEIESEAAGIERIDVFVDGRMVGTARGPGWHFVWEAPVQLGEAQIVAVAFTGDAPVGRRSLRTGGVEFGESISVVAVQLYPVVVDRAGRYVSHLEKDDFLLLHEGERFPLASFSREALDLTVYMLLDTSASMVPHMGVVREASARFVDHLRLEDRVALYKFDTTVVRLVEPTTDHGLVKGRLRELSARGGTALYDAVARVLFDLREVQGRKAIVLFSDGLDERSLLPLDRVAGLALASDVLIYAIGAGEAHDSARARQELSQLATLTGGEAFFVDRFRRIGEAYDAIVRDLRVQYSLSFTPPPGRPGRRRIELQLPNHRRLSVRSRTSYEYQPN